MSPVPEPQLLPYISTTTTIDSPNPVLQARQAIQTIGTTQQTQTCAGQYSGGTLAGAIVGTFFGTLFLIYLFNTLWTNRQKSETVVVEKRRRHRSHSGTGSRSSVRRPSRVYSTHG